MCWLNIVLREYTYHINLPIYFDSTIKFVNCLTERHDLFFRQYTYIPTLKFIIHTTQKVKFNVMCFSISNSYFFAFEIVWKNHIYKSDVDEKKIFTIKKNKKTGPPLIRTVRLQLKGKHNWTNKWLFNNSMNPIFQLINYPFRLGKQG